VGGTAEWGIDCLQDGDKELNMRTVVEATASPESALANWICQVELVDLPVEVQTTVQRMMLAVIGTGIAGAGEDGIAALRQMLLDSGGSHQATTLVFGDRLPAVAAAQFNATLCRALDFCDAMAPGPHFGAAVFPAALAAAELRMSEGYEVKGAEFIEALVVGAEVGARFNLTEAQYAGFDPTGIAAVFGAAAASGKVLQLGPGPMLHCLALAFNRCGGSFQSHVDGSLGVRVVQGWVAQGGVQCALMARAGLTGPQHFIAGHYGYAQLYGRGTLAPNKVIEGLGHDWRLRNMVFKKYPSCGVTQGVTELVLRTMRNHGIRPEHVLGGAVCLPPYAHRLVGHPFQVGSSPRVDAQFSAAYCVANAVMRGSSRLSHFTPAAVADPAVGALASRITVTPLADMDQRGHTAVDLRLDLAGGAIVTDQLDTAPGFPGAELTESEHAERFAECMSYAPRPLESLHQQSLLERTRNLATAESLQPWMELLTCP
jgi:2-methylcitrate dehydratase PrpD